MSVDNNGFITTPLPIQFQAVYVEVIQDTVNHLLEKFNDQIHSIYVYGSVANGCAIPEVSDLDITIIFSTSIDSLICRELRELQSVIVSKYTIISKIDFDFTSLREALDPINYLSWGYWLKHHCRAIFGEDLSKKIDLFKPSLELAIAVNGDFLAVVKKLERSLNASNSDSHRLLLQKSIARKIIRSTNILRSETDNDWPNTLVEYCDQFILKYPSLTKEIQYFLSVSLQPYGNIEFFIKRVNAFIAWLNKEYQCKIT